MFEIDVPASQVISTAAGYGAEGVSMERKTYRNL